ncbi:rhodanese-like domain-containing protein [Streptomyces thinghirensis]|uniref:rhodanese-like domain-containing protein n=1 Tax=Streptomyces thinghirensis TaxID=551547 RepID=UPI003CD07B1E
MHIELGDLPTRAADAPAGAVVHCGHGERATTAASLLERAGRTDRTVFNGGPDQYAAAHGQQLAQATEDTRS